MKKQRKNAARVRRRALAAQRAMAPDLKELIHERLRRSLSRTIGEPHTAETFADLTRKVAASLQIPVEYLMPAPALEYITLTLNFPYNPKEPHEQDAEESGTDSPASSSG